MGEILSLFSKAEIEHEYRYLLINSYKKTSLFNISSQVMKISDDLFLHDLKVVRSYWKNLEVKKGQSVISLIHKEAIQTYGEDCIYIFCHHPFEAYLLFNSLVEANSFGVYFLQNSMVKNLYQNLSISHWINCCKKIDECFDQSELLKKERKGVSTHYLRLEKMLRGLGISRLSDFKNLNSGDLKRRFSRYIGMLHDWTFPNQEEDRENNLDLFDYDRDVGLYSFPWVCLELDCKPSVKHDLDYPLSEWDHIKEELVRDFDKLTRFRQILSPSRIVLLKWRLTLFDLEQCQVFIRFKHPVCLLEDQRNDYEALISQFYFAFNSLEQKLSEQYQDYDYFDVAHFYAWSIDIEETISPSSINHELFLSLKEMVVDRDIEAFQNKIKGQVSRYSVLKIDIPSLDYKVVEQSEEVEVPAIKGLIRPFFIYEKPSLILEKDIKEKRFLERTSSDWWSRWDSRESFRDYYMGLVDGELLYIFKNHLNKWYKHGLFS